MGPVVSPPAGSTTSRACRKAGTGRSGIVGLAGLLACLVLAAGAAPAEGAVVPSVGPGPVATMFRSQHYRLALHLRPNRAFVAGVIEIRLWRDGKPLNGARVNLSFDMLDMSMPGPRGMLLQTEPGRYRSAGPVLRMPGRWALRFDVTPPHGRTFSLTLVDHMRY